MSLIDEELQRFNQCFRNRKVASATVIVSLNENTDELEYIFIGKAFTRDGDIVRPSDFLGDYVIRFNASVDHLVYRARFCKGAIEGEAEPIVANTQPCPQTHIGGEFGAVQLSSNGKVLEILKVLSPSQTGPTFLHYKLNFMVEREKGDPEVQERCDPRIINRVV